MRKNSRVEIQKYFIATVLGFQFVNFPFLLAMFWLGLGGQMGSESRLLTTWALWGCSSLIILSFAMVYVSMHLTPRFFPTKKSIFCIKIGICIGFLSPPIFMLMNGLGFSAIGPQGSLALFILGLLFPTSLIGVGTYLALAGWKQENSLVSCPTCPPGDRRMEWR